MGLSSSAEILQKKLTEIIVGNDLKQIAARGKVAILMDDIFVFADNEIEHDKILWEVLRNLSQAGITLNKNKCHFRVTSSIYLGCMISGEGIQMAPDKIKAIREMDIPGDEATLRSFLGLVSYHIKFLPNMTDLLVPLRKMLTTGIPEIWSEEEVGALNEAKAIMLSPPTLARYDVTKQTRVAADSSSYGLGGVLQQKHGQEWKPVYYISRTLNETERRYAQVEKEALASTWACERFYYYLYGLPSFELCTDHKPLLSILGTKAISDLTPRLQRFRMRLLPFSYVMKFVPGKEIHGPDVLSRRPLKETIPNQDILREEICVAALTEANLMTQPFSEAIWKQVTRAQAEDPTSNQLAATIIKGWPQHPDDLDNQLKPFFSVRGELNIQHSLVCKGNRIYTPKSLQKCFLSRLPEGHLGLEKCRSRAAVSVWWPHLSTQLTQAVEGCEECIRQRKNPKEPLMPTTLPDYPWQMVGADFLHAQGKEYLLIIDYFSTFPFLIPMKKKTAGAVIQELEPLFSIFGAPEIFRSDNGPPFNSFEFEAFCRTWEVTLIISSPRYPRSNGKAEAGVKKMKDILNKCSSMSDTYRGLLAYRDAQLQDGCTPAQLFLGRKTRTLLPVLPAELRPQWPDLPAVKQAHQERIQRAKEHHDRVTRARLLKPLSPGQKVFIRDLNIF